MKVEDFTYTLPKDKIATHPPRVRGDAKLLVLDRKSGAVDDKHYADLIDYLEPGDVLVLNDTKVLPARLTGLDQDGVEHELLVLEKHASGTFDRVLYRGQLEEGRVLTVNSQDITVVYLEDGGIAQVESEIDLLELAEKFGDVPLPPYMKRDATAEDVERYQTAFASQVGSVAAPTASLNLTTALLERIQAKGVQVGYLTLHVGLGTFLPIRVDNLDGHKMHSEYFEIPSETIDTIQRAKRVITVGTTVCRTLEYAADQIAAHTGSEAITGEADIFIYPGYEFKLVDGLLTNYHAPKSTVLMLAAAFAGWDSLLGAYNHALESDYRFLSYGDSMLIIGLT
jgi:S-adenosylmethionine:tRNA ribosyltransferase-isomerase